MARVAERLENDHLLEDYLRLLARYGDAPNGTTFPGHEIRTCAFCGQRAVFVLDPGGGWARCSACERYA